MRIDPAQRPEYFAFASGILGEAHEHGDCTKCLTSLSDDGQIQGVVIYDRITGWDCLAHLASNGGRRWLNREMLFWMFHVPFEQWGLGRITGFVAEDNVAALRFDLRLGFVIEGRIREATPDGLDGILIGMKRSECRFLNFKPGSI